MNSFFVFEVGFAIQRIRGSELEIFILEQILSWTQNTKIKIESEFSAVMFLIQMNEISFNKEMDNIFEKYKADFC